MAKLCTNVRFTVILLNGTRLPRMVRTQPGKMLLSSHVDEVLQQEAARLESFFPGREFRLVPLSNGHFNFVEMSKEEAELREKRTELQEKFSEAAAV